jgi:hypothetical protein
VKQFHHIGVPTKKKQANETYLAAATLYVTDAATDPFGIEWLRFEAGSPMPKEIQKSTHVAYKVDDIQAELAGQKVLIPPFEPMPGVKVAFILHEGVPVEFMQIG